MSNLRRAIETEIAKQTGIRETLRGFSVEDAYNQPWFDMEVWHLRKSWRDMVESGMMSNDEVNIMTSAVKSRAFIKYLIIELVKPFNRLTHYF